MTDRGDKVCFILEHFFLSWRLGLFWPIFARGSTSKVMFYFYLSVQTTNYFILAGSQFFPFPEPKKRKDLWKELELNPGPLTLQATTVNTRPCY